MILFIFKRSRTINEALSHVLNSIEDVENIKIIDIQKILQEEYDFDSSSFDCLNELAEDVWFLIMHGLSDEVSQSTLVKCQPDTASQIKMKNKIICGMIPLLQKMIEKNLESHSDV